MRHRRIVFVKPPDRFLENEFVFQQLGPHYLQSYLELYDIPSDLVVLYERLEVRQQRISGDPIQLSLDDLNMLVINHDGTSADTCFDSHFFASYDVVAMSVMTPQASDAYMLNQLIRKRWPSITTVIGGSHARYYQDKVLTLPQDTAFDFIVPQDGWNPMRSIATGSVVKGNSSIVLSDNHSKLKDIPAPTRPVTLMEKYNFHHQINTFHPN